jgi:hypothetical protein
MSGDYSLDTPWMEELAKSCDHISKRKEFTLFNRYTSWNVKFFGMIGVCIGMYYPHFNLNKDGDDSTTKFMKNAFCRIGSALFYGVVGAFFAEHFSCDELEPE